MSVQVRGRWFLGPLPRTDCVIVELHRSGWLRAECGWQTWVAPGSVAELDAATGRWAGHECGTSDAGSFNGWGGRR